MESDKNIITTREAESGLCEFAELYDLIEQSCLAQGLPSSEEDIIRIIEELLAKVWEEHQLDLSPEDTESPAEEVSLDIPPLESTDPSA